MPFSDPRVAKALEISVSRNGNLQDEIANLGRHPGGLYLQERRAEHAQTAFIRAVEDHGTNPYDIALRFLAKIPQELKAMREERRMELRDLRNALEVNQQVTA